jgi:hypothetical protein
MAGSTSPGKGDDTEVSPASGSIAPDAIGVREAVAGTGGAGEGARM